MTYPRLPALVPGEIPLVCTCYAGEEADWGEVLDALGGGGDQHTIVLDDDRVRLRLAEDPRWDDLPGGNFPALVSDGEAAPPVVVLADIPAVYGGDGVLLVDLREIPGRGVRVELDALGGVLAGLLGGALRFDDLVRGMDRSGIYQGGDEAPATPTPTRVICTGFPRLPVCEATLLVRTDFTDEQGWHAFAEVLGERGEDGWLHPDESDPDQVGLCALVVDDRRFEHLQPGQVPALVPPDRHTIMAALADAGTLADPAHPLLVVDLYDTPGQVTRKPLAEVGLMAVNLEIANLDFADFV